MKNYECSNQFVGIYALANAIVLQACNDYKWALLKLNRDPHNNKAKLYKSDCERFFGSKWYYMLTNVDHNIILNKIRDDVEKEGVKIDKNRKR